MATKLTLEPFLEPIAGPNPSGEDLRYTPVYDTIKEAKRADDQLGRGEWETEIKRSDWTAVIKTCNEALKYKTKDLQIAVWFTEALAHRHGFSGLAFGLRLISSLLADFWDSLYPEIEDGDLDFRIGPLTYLDEKLPVAICQVSICDPDRTAGFHFYHWEESRSLGKKDTQNQSRSNKDAPQDEKVGSDDFESAVKMSPLSFYKNLNKQLSECLKHAKSLDDIITEKFAPDPPGLSKLTNAVEACSRVVSKIYADKKKSEIAEGDDDDFGEEGDGAVQDAFSDRDFSNDDMGDENLNFQQNAISDITNAEKRLWQKVARKAGNGGLKPAFDQLMAAAALAPSVRQKNRYLLMVAKLCLKADRPDLAQPIAEQLYALIESLNLEKWEHSSWIADVIETLYRCLTSGANGDPGRAAQLFQKLCTLNITKAATFSSPGA